MIFQSGLNHLGNVFGIGGEAGCGWGLWKPGLKGRTAERKRAGDILGGQSRELGVIATKGRAQQRKRNRMYLVDTNDQRET